MAPDTLPACRVTRGVGCCAPALTTGSWADIVVAGAGVVVRDHGRGIVAECPERVDPAADPRGAVGVVLGHRGIGQRQGRTAVIEGAAAQTGPTATAVRLVLG